MSDPRETFGEYPWSRPFALRWNDNDVFGHVNNTIHYAAMDTTVTDWLIREAGVGLQERGEVAVVIASSCRYYASAAFPDTLLVGLRADRVGRTSIAWGLGIFREQDRELLATGTFVHVFVDRDQRRPVPVPERLVRLVEDRLVVRADGRGEGDDA